MRILTQSLLLLLVVPPAFAQEDGPVNQIHYPLAEELGEILKTADRAARLGRFEQAVELYRSVLDADTPKTGYQIARNSEKRTGSQPRRFRGITAWAIESLRALPADGIKLFRAKYDYRAGSAFDAARRERDPYRALIRAYELYPVSRHAASGLEAAADLALEAGSLARARRQLTRLLVHHEKELPNPPRIKLKLLMCSLGLGDAEAVSRVGRELRRDDPDSKIHLTSTPTTVDDLVAEALKVSALREGRYAKGKPTVGSVRGDASNRAKFDVGRLTFGPQRFRQRVFGDRSPIPRMQAGRIMPGTLPQGGLPARNLAVVYGGQAFVLTADKLMAFDLKTGERTRRIMSLPGRERFRDTNPKVQFGATINRGILVAPLVDKVLRDQSYRGIPIKVKIPMRKLAGFDLRRWRWSWDHARLLKNTPMARWSFPCPPVSQEGVIYVSAWAIEGFVDCNVAAFSALTGEPLWSTWIASGQVEQTMFGEQATEPLCVPVAVADGLVFHSTSFGSVAALDADTGRPVWVTEYRQIEVRAPRGYYADPRKIAWENNAPVVEAGVVVVAPLDSPSFYGYDAKTGRRLWEASRRRYAAEADMRYVMGASDGRVVLGGGHHVRCIDVRSGKISWQTSLRGRLVAGRGCIAGRYACVPVDRNEVYLLDMTSGKRVGRYALSATGNLLLAGSDLVISGNGTLAVHRTGVAGSEGKDFK